MREDWDEQGLSSVPPHFFLSLSFFFLACQLRRTLSRLHIHRVLKFSPNSCPLYNIVSSGLWQKNFVTCPNFWKWKLYSIKSEITQDKSKMHSFVTMCCISSCNLDNEFFRDKNTNYFSWRLQMSPCRKRTKLVFKVKKRNRVHHQGKVPVRKRVLIWNDHQLGLALAHWRRERKREVHLNRNPEAISP